MRVVHSRKAFNAVIRSRSLTTPIFEDIRLLQARCQTFTPRLTRRLLSRSTNRRHDISSPIVSSQELPRLPKERSANSREESGTWSNSRYLPLSCPGCGALTQSSETQNPGFYSTTRRVVRRFLKQRKAQTSDGQLKTQEETEGSKYEGDVDTEETDAAIKSADKSTEKIPYCDRCHDLIYNSRGQSIAHPTIEDLADSIAESPFRRNHVYHVIDAADFPMSLVPDIFSKVSLAKPRSQNRRSQHDFSTKPTLSFIVTRSDLLGSTKEVVDSMMTYFQSVLRHALGRSGKDLRLGNIHLVSAKRGWWTKELKDDIWKRGGGTWMLGKVNVGKSNLFEVLFPKGSGDRAPVYAELQESQRKEGRDLTSNDLMLNESSLLPPAQEEHPFPVFPVVSSLPGTTASPIRLPFGGHRGELIDLPGLERGTLEDYVKQEHRLELIMTHRHNVEQYIIKPGQSMLLGGGLIRITPNLDPNDPSTTMLAYPFVPLKVHVTATDKAVALQAQNQHSGVGSIVADGAGIHMASAGVLELSSDVTKTRSGPVLRSGVSLSKLPYRVYATDVLLEGIGWIELVCQTRRFRKSPINPAILAPTGEISDPKGGDSQITTTTTPEFLPFSKVAPPESTVDQSFPTVEIFSPKGKHISSRPSLGAWVRWTESRKTSTGHASPRRSKRSVKRY